MGGSIKELSITKEAEPQKTPNHPLTRAALEHEQKTKSLPTGLMHPQMDSSGPRSAPGSLGTSELGEQEAAPFGLVPLH